MKTIAEQIKWDFKTNGELVIRDKNGNEIYSEDLNGYWAKWEYDSKGNCIYYEDSNGFWSKSEYDSKGNQIYYEDSDGKKGQSLSTILKAMEIYYEDSDGKITDNRPKPSTELSLESLAEQVSKLTEIVTRFVNKE